MTTIPKHTRQFNLQHARAGAPFCCSQHGPEYDIIKWDRDHHLCIVAMAKSPGAEIVTFDANGMPSNGNAGQALVMTPLGYIDGKPVFVGDEIEMKCLAKPIEWKRVKAEPGWAGTWNDEGTLARWPEPAKVYPETRMTGSELVKALNETFSARRNGGWENACVAVANAALRHAIDAGQVVVLGEGAPTNEAYDQCSRDLGKAERLLESLGYRSAGNGEWAAPDVTGDVRGLFAALAGTSSSDRASRDMAVAKAICYNLCNRTDFSVHHLEAIISTVKEGA